MLRFRQSLSEVQRFMMLSQFSRLAWGVYFVMALSAPGWADDMTASQRVAVDEAIYLVKPALVRIHVVSAEYDEGRELKEQSTGSGAIISRDGYVVTNHHVAGHATRLFCTLANRQEIEADLVGADPLTDIAVIKLKPAEPTEFPMVVFGDSAAVKVGDTVLALGSPRSLSQSVTLGIVSNTEIVLPENMRAWGTVELDGEDVGSLVKWIGHDAMIHPGNSGGPLINLKGEIVGVNELDMGIGAAIPGNLAKQVAEALIAKGSVTRAWIGLSVQPQLKNAADKRGVVVSGTISGSPSALAGMLPGDVLLSLNGTPTDVRFDEELPAFNLQVAALAIGQPVEAVVLRAGQEVKLALTPVERSKMKPKESELKAWGITASDVPLITAKEMKRDSLEGVFITSLRSGGPAADAKPSLARRDILVEVAGKPVKNVAELQALTAELLKDTKDPIPVLTTFERKTQRYVTVVKVGIRELVDPGLEVRKAWLPVETQVMTRDIAEQLGDAKMTGFRVTSVYPGSTAATAGLQVGDLLLAVDGEKLTASAPEHYEELPALIRQYRIGTTAQLSVRRGQELLTVPVELVQSPKLNREMKEYRDERFELTVRDMSFFDKATEQIQESQQGVLVTEVKPGGWASLGRLDVGDVILSIDGEPITGIESFEAKMQQLESGKPKFAVFQVLRKIYTIYVELEPNWDAVSGKD